MDIVWDYNETRAGAHEKVQAKRAATSRSTGTSGHRLLYSLERFAHILYLMLTSRTNLTYIHITATKTVAHIHITLHSDCPVLSSYTLKGCMGRMVQQQEILYSECSKSLWSPFCANKSSLVVQSRHLQVHRLCATIPWCRTFLNTSAIGLSTSPTKRRVPRRTFYCHSAPSLAWSQCACACESSTSSAKDYVDRAE
jgi:hypothetical protein